MDELLMDDDLLRKIKKNGTKNFNAAYGFVASPLNNDGAPYYFDIYEHKVMWEEKVL